MLTFFEPRAEIQRANDKQFKEILALWILAPNHKVIFFFCLGMYNYLVFIL